MSGEYEFDRSSFYFTKKKRPLPVRILLAVLKFFAVTLLLAVVYYTLFALVFSSDSERKLWHENRSYEKIAPVMQERIALLGDVIQGIRAKDSHIYMDIFNSDAPAMDPVNTLDILSGNDTVPDRSIVLSTAAKSDRLMQRASSIESLLEGVLETSPDSLPPLMIPIKASYAQIAASVGDKVNPFYKVPMHHTGLDIITSRGEDVFCSADGVVTGVIRSRKGQGNVVEVTHPNGYMTRYCHLDDILVYKGRRVRLGQKIGTVGVSGNSFAPHLHYEVLRGEEYMNPVHFFFASVSPDEYANMLYMSVNTGQSMD